MTVSLEFLLAAFVLFVGAALYLFGKRKIEKDGQQDSRVRDGNIHALESRRVKGGRVNTTPKD